MQKQSFLFLLLLLGVLLLAAYQALSDAPSSQAIIRFLALAAFFLLCVSLTIGPLVVLRPHQFAHLIEPRRAVGLAAFFFAALHTLLVLALYFGWDFGSLLQTVPPDFPFIALAILTALALTSCDFAVQKMGAAKWKTLQCFAYPAFVLILAHLVLRSNGLFTKQGIAPSLNLSEAALIVLAAFTIILQAAGFYVRIKRKAAVSGSQGDKK